MKKLVFILVLMTSFKTIAQSNIELELRTAEAKSVEYMFKTNAWLEMPAELATTAPSTITIYYNYTGPEEYEFSCHYASSSSRTTSDFIDCMTTDGQVIMDQPTDLELLKFPMDKNSILMMEVTGSQSDRAVIRASFNVNWK